MAQTYDFAGTGALSGDWVEAVAGVDIVERVSGLGEGNVKDGTFKMYYYTAGGQPADDQYSQIDIVGGEASNSNYGGVCARANNTSGGNGYYARRSMLGTGRTYIDEYSNGSITNLAYSSSNNGGGVNNFKMTITGTTGTNIVVNDGISDIVTESDGTHTAGYGGFAYRSNVSSDFLQLDNWEGSNGVGGEAITPDKWHPESQKPYREIPEVLAY